MKPEDQDQSLGAHIFLVCFFFLFFNILILNCFIIILKMASSKQPKWSFLNFLYWITNETYGVEVNLALFKENEFGDPRFLFFFLKGIKIVHELKIFFKIFNIRFYNTWFVLKTNFNFRRNAKVYHAVSCRSMGKQINLHIFSNVWGHGQYFKLKEKSWMKITTVLARYLGIVLLF